MMNRVFGTLCALAIIAVMVFAVLNWGNYTSMCFAVPEPAPEPIIDTATYEPTELIIPEDTIPETVEIVE